MATDIRQLLLAAFDIEHREHIGAIRAALRADAPDWNDVFRRAHSLKGASRAVDLPAVEAVSHRLETLFERVRTGGMALDREAASAVELALDRIETYVAGLSGGAGPDMPGDAIDALGRLLGQPVSAASPPLPPTLPPPLPHRHFAPPAPPTPAPVEPPPTPKKPPPSGRPRRRSPPLPSSGCPPRR